MQELFSLTGSAGMCVTVLHSRSRKWVLDLENGPVDIWSRTFSAKSRVLGRGPEFDASMVRYNVCSDYYRLTAQESAASDG